MLPFLGYGIGLRPVHYADLLDGAPGAEWYEVISENYMIRGGRPLHVLERVRERVPIMLHGVSLSLGSTDPLNETYLAELRELAQRFEPAGVSDHLCWGSIGGRYAHDLLPLPYTEEALAHVADRIRRVQDALGRRILVENVSSYLTFHHSVLPEWKFLAAVAERADCGILFDVNNVYVSAMNHGFSAETYLDAIPADRVGQIHLAGHSDHGTHLLDTHDHPVCPDVWSLYQRAIRRFGPVSTLIEWDADIPPLPVLLEEAARARRLAAATEPGHADAAPA